MDGPSGAKVPKSEIGIGTEISLKMNKKIEFASKLTKKIPLKMLVDFKKNCDRLKIYIKITFNFKRDIRRKMLVGVKIP